MAGVVDRGITEIRDESCSAKDSQDVTPLVQVTKKQKTSLLSHKILWKEKDGTSCKKIRKGVCVS